MTTQNFMLCFLFRPRRSAKNLEVELQVLQTQWSTVLQLTAPAMMANQTESHFISKQFKILFDIINSKGAWRIFKTDVGKHKFTSCLNSSTLSGTYGPSKAASTTQVFLFIEMSLEKCVCLKVRISLSCHKKFVMKTHKGRASAW